jgi:hypothetical protein
MIFCVKRLEGGRWLLVDIVADPKAALGVIANIRGQWRIELWDGDNWTTVMSGFPVAALNE